MNFITKATSEAKLITETVNKSIEAASKALNLYDKLVERVIPWKEFNASIVELDKFRKDYSTESAQLIGEIKTLMMNGIDAYFAASQNIYEWASLAAPQLKLYIKLFKGHGARPAEAQKKILVNMLDHGVEKMTDAQAELTKSSSSFNLAGGQLTQLQGRFYEEFDEKSIYFQTKVKNIRIGAYVGGGKCLRW